MKIKKITAEILFILITTVFYSFDLPTGWFKAGSDSNSYDMGVDKGSGQDHSNAATIKSNADKIKGFGTLMQNCSPDKFLGRRIRMSGFVKSKDVNNKAGLWLRVDQANTNERLGFDNMMDRPITGTTDWKKYEIVLDIPANASNLAYGALLNGTGQIWFDKLNFEIVDNTIPVTGDSKKVPVNAEPVNLDFEK